MPLRPKSTGSTAVEKNLRAEVIKKAERLDGTGMESAPALKGYVRYIAKPFVVDGNTLRYSRVVDRDFSVDIPLT